MRITGVEVLAIPDGGDSMMLVLVDTDAGVSGLGEVGIRTRQEAVRGALAHLADVLVGQGVPVYRLLGGKVREWVPCYAHVPGEDGPLDVFVAACQDLVAQGWRHLRFSVPTPHSPLMEPRQSVRAALQRFQILRAAR